MDWLYADDTPRAERAATRLSLDREMLDELMGGEGAGADAATARALEEVVARRQGTAPRRQARDVDELTVLLERAGDLSPDELRARVAAPADWVRGIDPLDALLASGRVAVLALSPTIPADRVVLLEMRPRYEAAAAGDRAARREILARYLASSGAVTVQELEARYGWPARGSRRDWRIGSAPGSWCVAGFAQVWTRLSGVRAVCWSTRGGVRSVHCARRYSLSIAQRSWRSCCGGSMSIHGTGCRASPVSPPQSSSWRDSCGPPPDGNATICRCASSDTRRVVVPTHERRVARLGRFATAGSGGRCRGNARRRSILRARSRSGVARAG